MTESVMGVAHADLVTAARAFTAAQVGGQRAEAEAVVRLALGTADSRAFIFEYRDGVYVETTGALTDADAFTDFVECAGRFAVTALRGLDEPKRTAVKDALDAGALLGVDVHASGFVTLSVGQGTQAVLVCAVAPGEPATSH